MMGYYVGWVLCELDAWESILGWGSTSVGLAG